MIDLYFFNSSKMGIVFILILLSVTLEAQNENDNFYELITAIGEHFHGEFNVTEKALELDLNGANAFLEELHTFASRQIVRKDENGEFECKESKKADFKMAIQSIVGEDARNLLKAIIVPKRRGSVTHSANDLHTIKTLVFEKGHKKVVDLLTELSVQFSEAQLFNLLFSFATRLEALVHGKNIDGTLKETQENSKDKIQTFLAVPKCFILPDRGLIIFDYWIKIIKMKTAESQVPIFGVAIYKEKYDVHKKENSKQEAFKFSRENYEILKQLNDQKFSIYESIKFLRKARNWIYSYSRGKQRIPSGKILEIFVNLLNQIKSVFFFNWKWENKIYECEYAMFFQIISECLMKMMRDKMIDPELHLDSIDNEIREDVQKIEESCKKFDNEEAKIIFLNNVHYELAINFEFNQCKDVHDRAEDLLLSDWVGNSAERLRQYGITHEESYLKKNANLIVRKISDFTSKTNAEKISIIEALIGKEHIHQFNLMALFNRIKTLAEVAIPEENAKFWKAVQKINKKQLENDIEFLKNNPKSIAEEKYQNAVRIICTIRQFGEKAENIKSNIQYIEQIPDLHELLLKIQQYREDFGPELWEQTKECCNQLKLEQIKMEEIVTEKRLKDFIFEIDEIKRYLGWGWESIRDYNLEIPLMQLKDQARALAKTFEKMLEAVKDHYARKMDESNVGGDMIISE